MGKYSNIFNKFNAQRTEYIFVDISHRICISRYFTVSSFTTQHEIARTNCQLCLLSGWALDGGKAGIGGDINIKQENWNIWKSADADRDGHSE